MRYPHPRENQKADVVHHLMQIGLAGRCIPTDKEIAALHLPCGGTPTQASNQPPIEVGQGT